MNRLDVLQQNHEARQFGGVKQSDGLRLALNIPDADYMRLCIGNPELKSKDAHTKSKAWLKFIRSPLSEPYRVAKAV